MSLSPNFLGLMSVCFTSALQGTEEELGKKNMAFYMAIQKPSTHTKIQDPSYLNPGVWDELPSVVKKHL